MDIELPEHLERWLAIVKKLFDAEQHELPDPASLDPEVEAMYPLVEMGMVFAFIEQVVAADDDELRELRQRHPGANQMIQTALMDAVRALAAQTGTKRAQLWEKAGPVVRQLYEAEVGLPPRSADDMAVLALHALP
jgi:hypothetical protein